jgi:hypothetical protein
MEPLQRAASCVTESVFRPSARGYSAGTGHAMILNKGRPVRLSAAQPLLLFAQLEYDVVRTDDVDRGPWKVRTRGYRYHVLSADEDEVALYHWHPGGTSTYEDPHVHVGPTQLHGEAIITKRMHLPSGRIAFEQVLTLMIREFGVEPRRDDHEAVIEDCFSRFAKWRTWT